MTREFYNKYRAEIEAWGRGEEVEWRYSNESIWYSLGLTDVFDTDEIGMGLQLRLKPKRVEGWVVAYKDGSFGTLHLTHNCAERWARGARIIHMIEAPE